MRHENIDDLRNELQTVMASFPMNVFYYKAAALVQGAVMKQFRTEGRFFGTPWDPLAPATQKERKKKGFGEKHPILRRRGGDAGLVGSVYTTLSGDGINIGVGPNAFYGKYLHYGASYTSSRSGGASITLPPRPFLPEHGLPEEVTEEIAQTYLEMQVKHFEGRL